MVQKFNIPRSPDHAAVSARQLVLADDPPTGRGSEPCLTAVFSETTFERRLLPYQRQENVLIELANLNALIVNGVILVARVPVFKRA